VRHQGKPIRPECYPKQKVEKAAAPKQQLQPTIQRDAKGRPIALPMRTRAAPVYRPGKTAIKLTGAAGARAANASAAAAAAGVVDGARRKLLQGSPLVHTLLIVYTDAAAAGALLSTCNMR
jgi:hypothetical protein